MSDMEKQIARHPTESELTEFMARSLTRDRAAEVGDHLSRCDACLAAYVAAYESVMPKPRPTGGARQDRTGRGVKRILRRLIDIVKRVNIYLALAVVSFIMSFIAPRYFIQLLAATLIFGMKWVIDSRSTRMLIMIHEAWKSGGGQEASRVIERLGKRL
jgi:hypothetical protein